MIHSVAMSHDASANMNIHDAFLSHVAIFVCPKMSHDAAHYFSAFSKILREPLFPQLMTPQRDNSNVSEKPFLMYVVTSTVVNDK